MTDITDRTLSELVGVLDKLSGSMKKMTIDGANGKGTKSANDGLEVEVRRQGKLAGFMNSSVTQQNQAISRSTQSLGNMTESTNRFADSLADAAKKMPAGFIIAAIANYANNALDTYQDLSNIGMTFGGSMVRMSVAAGSAGLSLKDFGSISEKNNKVIGHMGERFFEVNKELRQTTEYAGNFGMTLKQLYDVSGGYLENLRLMGAVNSRSSKDQARSIADLAESVSMMSGVTKKNREQIMADANRSLQDASVMAMMATNTEKGLHKLNDSIIKAAHNLSAQFGGEKIAEGLLQSMALGGAQFSQTAQDYLDAGFSEGALLLQQGYEKINAGIDPDIVSMELTNAMKDSLDNPVMREALLNQARAGNQQAKELLAQAQNLKKYTAEDMARAKREAKQKEAFTGLVTSLESILANLRGSLIEGFLKPFSDALGGTSWETTFDNLKKYFKPVEDAFKALGNAWGREFKSWLESGGPELVAKMLTKFAQQGMDVASKVFSPTNIDTAMRLFGVFAKLVTLVPLVAAVLIPVIDVALKLVDGFNGVVTSILRLFDPTGGKIAEAIGGLATGILVLAGIWFAKQKLTDMMGRLVGVMNVQAGQVIINGGSLGGGRRRRNRGGGTGGNNNNRNRNGNGNGNNNNRNGNNPRGAGGTGGGSAGGNNGASRGGNAISRMGSRIGGMRVSQFAGRAALPIGAIVAGMDALSAKKFLDEQLAAGAITKEEHGKEMAKIAGGAAGGVAGGWAGATAGASAGAMAGGAIGALFGGVGAVPGAAIGGAIGGIAGGMAGFSLGDWLGENVGGFLASPEGKMMTAIVNPAAGVGMVANNALRGRSLFDFGQGEANAPNNVSNSEKMAENRAVSNQDKAMRELIEGINKLNKNAEEGRQISVAQLERLDRNNVGQRNVQGAIADNIR